MLLPRRPAQVRTDQDRVAHRREAPGQREKGQDQTVKGPVVRREGEDRAEGAAEWVDHHRLKLNSSF
jgi:hypothetical protein